MANYNLVADYSFRPFTFDEMIKPLLMYKDEYEKRENDYLTLQSNADKLKYLSSNLPEGSKAKRIFDNYASALESYAKDFSRNGISIGNKRGLLDLKRRYEGEIGALEKAVLLKKTQEDAQMQALVKDPTMLFSMDAFSTPVDSYLDNPDLSFTPYSGATLTAQSAGIAGILAKELKDVMQGKPSNYLATFTKKYGYTSSEIAKAIQNPETMRDYEILDTVLNNVVGSSPIGKWTDANTRRRAMEYARLGLWNAIGSNQASVHNLPRPISSRTPSPGGTVVVDPIDASMFPNTGTVTGNATAEGVLDGTYAYGGYLNLFAGGGPTDTQNSGDTTVSAESQTVQPADSIKFDSTFLNKVGAMPLQDRISQLKKYAGVAEGESLTKETSQLGLENWQKAYITARLVSQSNAIFAKNLEDIPMRYTPRNILTQLEQEGVENLEHFADYFTRDDDGNYTGLSAKGKREINKSGQVQGAVPRYGIIPSFGMAIPPVDRRSPFMMFLDNAGLNGLNSSDEKVRNNALQTLARYKTIIENGTNLPDATVSKEFEMGIHDADLKDVLQSVLDANTRGTLYNYRRTKNNGEDKKEHPYNWVRTGEAIDVDVLKKKLEGATVVYGKHGIYLQLRAGGKEYKIPFSQLNESANQSAKAILSELETVQQARNMNNSPFHFLRNKNGDPVDVEAVMRDYINSIGNNLIVSLARTAIEEPKAKQITYPIYETINSGE